MAASAKSISEGWRLSIATCGWAHCLLLLWSNVVFFFFWLQTAIEPFALFRSVLVVIRVLLCCFNGRVNRTHTSRKHAYIILIPLNPTFI